VLYIGAGMGPGPRDGMTTGLVARTGLSVRLVRTSIEATVLAVGWLLGGTVGVGTVVYALGIGPLVQLFVRWTPRRWLAASGWAFTDSSLTTMGECEEPKTTLGRAQRREMALRRAKRRGLTQSTPTC
jgi:hypothetical protein